MNLQSEIISFRPRSRYVLRFSQDVVRSSWSSSGVMPPGINPVFLTNGVKELL